MTYIQLYKWYEIWTYKDFIHKQRLSDRDLGRYDNLLSTENIFYFQETDWEWEDKKIIHSSANHKKSVVYLRKLK